MQIVEALEIGYSPSSSSGRNPALFEIHRKIMGVAFLTEVQGAHRRLLSPQS